MTYVLDLAEIPSFQLLGDWRTDWKDQKALSERSQQQAKNWVDNLVVTQAGERVPLHVSAVSASANEGAGGMAVVRITIVAEAGLMPGDVTYQDQNFPGRAGWKEIVVDHDPTVAIESSSNSTQDISRGLTYYPTDPRITPPQDLSAHINWSTVPDVSSASRKNEKTLRNVVHLAELPARAPIQTTNVMAAPTKSFSQQQPEGRGAVVRGDFLSKILQRKNLPGEAILIGIFVAFGLGAAHAMSPGHGKTIVAAYLVGNRGTLKHAGLLGLVVTFTHTFVVFLVGLSVLFFQRYIVAEKIVPILGVVSGLSIVSIGLMLLYQRSKALLEGDSNHVHSHGPHVHSHDHEHDHVFHDHHHAPTRIAELAAVRAGGFADTDRHDLSIDTEHTHHHHHHGNSLVHSHGGTTHSHVIEGDITPGSLIALGISGGLVPCPSALILMLSAIALGHPGLGMLFLIAFSTGLALVLIGFGVLAVCAKQLLPKGERVTNKPIFRLIPVFSAVVVICLGLVMTAVSAGWLQPPRFLS